MITPEAAFAPSAPVAPVKSMVRAPIKRPRKVIIAVAPVSADAPVAPAPTPLEVQLAEQLKEQVRQTEVMKQMLASLQEAEAARKAEKERKADAARKADEACKAKEVASHKAEEERKAEAMRKTCAFLLTKGIKVVMPRANMDKSLTTLLRLQLAAVEDFSNARTKLAAAETEQQWSARFRVCRDLHCEIKDIIEKIHEKERELAKPMEEERKRRELAEHLLHQEEARKRSAAQIQLGKYSIWMKYQNEHCMGTPQELIAKGYHVWSSDRTPITVDGKVCVGPRLGEYMGVNLGSILAGGGITRSGYTHGNGVTYDGTVEPKLY